jgi:plastocyanin
MRACISRRALVLAGGGALSFIAAAIIAPQTWSSSSDQIGIEDFAFGPPNLTIPAGTQVTWVNRDEEPHTVNSASKAAPFKSAALDTGDKFSFVFNQAGRYKYFCSIHPYMVGTIVVK